MSSAYIDAVLAWKLHILVRSTTSRSRRRSRSSARVERGGRDDLRFRRGHDEGLKLEGMDVVGKEDANSSDQGFL